MQFIFLFPLYSQIGLSANVTKCGFMRIYNWKLREDPVSLMRKLLRLRKSIFKFFLACVLNLDTDNDRKGVEGGNEV